MPRVQVRTYVDSTLRDEWERQFGDYASLSWLMETSMSEVLKITHDTPSLAEVVKAQIKTHVLKHQHQPNKPRPQNVQPVTGA